jgi:hypothetical protein
MSTVKNPTKKKQVSYERDHYNRGGEHSKAWRKAKPLKKAKARRAYRKTANDLSRVCAEDEAAPIAATRKHDGIQQRRVDDWGAIGLRDFVASRLDRREATVGAKKKRKARAEQTIATRNTRTNALQRSAPDSRSRCCLTPAPAWAVPAPRPRVAEFVVVRRFSASPMNERKRSQSQNDA